MIFGDPYKFAIQFDFVEDWKSELTDQGILNFLALGYQKDLAPQSLTILDCMDSLQSIYFNLISIKSQEKIFNMEDDEAYDFLYNLVMLFRSGNDIDDKDIDIYKSCNITINELLFDDNFFWIVSFEDKEKIIFKIKNEIKSIVLNRGYCENVIRKCLFWAKEYYSNEDRFENLVS